MTNPQNAPKRDKNDDNSDDSGDEDVFHDAHFPAEEEAQLLKESQEIKSEANQLFLAASYDQAISCYDRALASCPNYLDYDVAVLHSNVAACHLKLEAWKSAVDSATVSIERLEKIIPSTPLNKSNDTKGSEATKQDKKDSDDVVEISGDDEDAELEHLKRLEEQDELRNKVLRLRAKVLMRRAKAKVQIGGWGSLQGAAEDYQGLVAIETVSADDKRIAQRELRELPARISEAREKEMGDMMGKLKDVSISPCYLLDLVGGTNMIQLGNGILSPFGLSTDNFKFVQDPKTGGYNMNFQS
ncbi:unnamed protein product [Penicillium salamii]|uniref:Tetratricopeptide-like helical n=1 Tax=Penicillium salamii TaxID=1612424 RepID=A0A9W4IQF8_9EURO|nr:unnamed protein product [Penicillium salamii]CAG8135368.1 unnamed protein product [Penicillium salamii]CAG8257176.1 unnamed protein product [Penicillium salamii]CAG8311382.1 unnamed protein product [Penicillium salamii]CAG8318827.1 unnamed protein product [Penicillium salamii]